MMSTHATIEVLLRDDDAPDLFASESGSAEPLREEPALEVVAAAPPPAPKPSVAPHPVASVAIAAPAKIAAAVTPAPSRAVQTVSVHDVLVRQISVGWFEAVAIIAEASTIGAAAGPDASFPAAAGILLTSQGAILLQQGRSTEQPVAAAGRTLHALLSDASGAPAGLRLLATAAADAYPTLADFAGAVAYFARPDRRELIRAVFERCNAVPAPAEGAQKTETTPAAETRRPRSWRVPSWAPIAAGVICVLGTLIAVWTVWPAAARDVPPVAAVVAQTQGIVKKVGDGIRSTLGLQPSAPATSTAARSNATSAAPAPARRVAASRIRERSLAIASRPLQVPSREIGTFGETAPVPSTAAATAAPEPAPMLAPGETVIMRATETPVYSRADADVRPPVMTYPRLPQSALPEILSPIVNKLELLVREDGSVERVRMLSRPRRMSDMMILSGIKMWRFEPASKAGRPVKYLTVLNWTVTP